MPVKRRRSKRRTNPEAEARAWDVVFTCGHDFFGDAEDLTGVPEPVHVRPDARPAAEKAWRATAEDAWRRVGALWAQQVHDPGEWPLAECWAVKQFGDPTCQ